MLIENPWPSELWNVQAIRKLLDIEHFDAETQELLEVVRGDQCRYGLRDRLNQLPHMKPTGFMTASAPVKRNLSLRCQGDHTHQQLEGSNRTKHSQVWPPDLCKAILDGFLEELECRTMNAAFHNEIVAEDDAETTMDLGILDSIRDDRDFSLQRDLLPDRLNPEELSRQEMLEERPLTNGEEMALESERRRKWLRIPRPTRLALRRLRNMTGHGAPSSVIQLLRTAQASPAVLEACRHFACETCRKNQQVQKPNITKMPNKPVFNHEIALDALEVRDFGGNRHTILSAVCLGTLFHQCWWVAPGGVPRSSTCAEALLNGWISPFGPPTVVTCDRGMRSQGKLKDLLRVNGIQLRYTGVEAPFQLGRGERQGSIFKDLIYAAIEERQILGTKEMQILIAETCVVKNMKLHHHGFTPYQWVLGKLPVDPTSLLSEEAEGQFLGPDVLEPEEEFGFRLQVRQAAKSAFNKVDSGRRVRAALLRKSVPMRGPYAQGDLVCFHRRGRWHGPARIIGREGRAAVWLMHGGIPLAAAESNLRPASSAEIYTKRLLDLRPSRKRLRQVLEERPELQDEIPFMDDYHFQQWNEGDDESQPRFVDLPSSGDGAMETPYPQRAEDSQMPEGQAEAEPETPFLDQAQQREPPAPLEVIAEAEPPVPFNDLASDISTPIYSSPTEEPEHEQMPGTAQDTPRLTPLVQAMRRSPDNLDGVPHIPIPPGIAPPPGLSSRPRSRSPVREPHNVPVPADPAEALLLRERSYAFECFLAKRFQKKKKLGPHRELTYTKENDEVKAEIDKSRLKEWSNWKKYEAVQILSPSEAERFLHDNPSTEVLPSRWVDTDKAEVGQKSQFKSRLVALGHLEKTDNVRTDSPTASQLFLNLIIAYAACSGLPLRAGDISAAFLQGAVIQRLLALTLPKDGIPDETIQPGSMLLARKSVYGTRDAPRGFWKALHDELLRAGLLPVPGETSAYFLPGPHGEVHGLLGCHVDDLLWVGPPAMQEAIQKVQEKFQFRIVEDNELKYCGRTIQQTSTGIHVSCPNVLDRTKAIYVDPVRRKKLSEPAAQSEIGQLRSVIGSLSWLGRICRPDICFGVNQLQAIQQKAQVRHLLEANKLLNYAMQDRNKGIFYPVKAFEFEQAILLSITDASHAASFESVGLNTVAGHRSQSGRILALADPTFATTGEGKVMLLDWRSNTIRRVCRSTLQAETLSLLQGSEEAEHVRQVLFHLKNKAPAVKKNDIFREAMNDTKLLWCTDCRSLTDHIVNANMTEVSDKRLAIDLTSLRQTIWRRPSESEGNPVYSESLPEDATTLIRWISTGSMVSDALTKQMRADQLDELTGEGYLKVEWQRKDVAKDEKNEDSANVAMTPATRRRREKKPPKFSLSPTPENLEGCEN